MLPSLCLGLDVVDVRVAGTGLGVVPNAGHRVYAQAALGIVERLPLWGVLRLRAAVEATAPFVRHDYDIEWAGTVFRTWVFGLSASLGTELVF